jgi:putative endonuclease
MKRRQKGQRGESFAAAALEQAGYQILTRNWRCDLGELDIIAQHEGEIVFVEVRAKFDGIDSALESITPAKQNKLIRLAERYLDENGSADVSFRFDVVAIELTMREPVIEIIRDAIGW